MIVPCPFKRCDVRDLLKRGIQPLPEILRQIDLLGSGEGLLVIAPFFPTPLIQLLGREGFQARHERKGAAEWRAYFWRPNEGTHHDQRTC